MAECGEQGCSFGKRGRVSHFTEDSAVGMVPDTPERPGASCLQVALGGRASRKKGCRRKSVERTRGTRLCPEGETVTCSDPERHLGSRTQASNKGIESRGVLTVPRGANRAISRRARVMGDTQLGSRFGATRRQGAAFARRRHAAEVHGFARLDLGGPACASEGGRSGSSGYPAQAVRAVDDGVSLARKQGQPSRARAR